MRLNRLYSLGILATTVALASIAQPARAISFTLGDNAATQASMKGIAGFGGETNQGAYSIYAQTEGFNTVAFNDGSFAVVDNQNQLVADAGITYSYIGNTTKNARITSDQWAPTFASPRDNKSKYLTAFSGTDVQINLDTTHNYFGINWGSAHDGNEFSFYNGDALVQKFVYYGDNRTFAADTKTTNVASALQTYGTKGNGNQYNAYFNFFADSSDDIFNRILISQAGGGGFETDNHTFKAGTKGFNDVESVPEPAMALSLLVVGGAMVAKRRSMGSQVS
ncbi:PEP-CTERM sorting domain-containing protein [Nodosilinea sp. LEGE 07088]|uniref:PEP-CTERM sorting domain-containing protein n=1 Tax=Nodosilinea sp. LEGE 07088 TaxID=2777968 RepID=UPI00188086F8|nr:PEP-CTERM sorting domain-containing protein [Nodosilinea sp. LEGE 07088]MBE9137583.1 PEP-CTERM sorting domain-containing protein [Nodosilinea sp. LEGE 07088]